MVSKQLRRIMPRLPPKQCSYSMCKDYVTKNGRCDKHQHKAWASSEGKTASERGYGSKWQKIRKQALQRDDHLCQECLKQNIYTQAKDVDHIISKAKGGSDELENLQSLCNPCHKKKTAEERNKD